MTDFAISSPTTKDLSPRRDRVLDEIRGIFILMMIAGHLGPGSLISLLAHPCAHFMDAASGFVFLSGLTLGMIHAGRIARFGAQGAITRILRRAAMLWATHCGLVLIAVISSETTGRPYWVQPVATLGGWRNVIVQTFLLRFQPGYMDILPLFIIFLLISPAVLETIRRGYSWIIMIIVLGVYVWTQFHPDGLNYALRDVDGDITEFHLGAWQALFFAGMVIGWRWKQVRGFLVGGNAPWLWVLCIVVFIGLAILDQFQRKSFGIVLRLPPAVIDFWFSRRTQAPGRFLFLLTGLPIFYWALAWAETQARFQPIRSTLQTFGQNGLYCFILHLILVLFVALTDADKLAFPAPDIIVVLSIILIYFMARRATFRKRPNDERNYL